MIKLRHAFLLVSLTLTLFACSSETPIDSPSASPALDKVRVGISPVMTSAGVFIAYEEGFFRDQGLDVELIDFKKSGAPQIPLLATGRLDVGGGNMNVGLLNAVASGLPIKVVGDKGTCIPGLPFLATIVRQDLWESGQVRTPADLSGRRMAITAAGVSQEIQTEAVLKTANLTLDDVEMRNLSYRDMNVALEAGELDATVQIEPHINHAIERGVAVRMIGSDEVTPMMSSGVLFYSMTWAEANPETARKFFVAYVQGIRAYIDAFFFGRRRDRIVGILIDHTPVKDRAAYQQITPVGLTPNGGAQWDDIVESMSWFLERGYLSERLTPDQFMDRSYSDHAAAVLGAYQPPADTVPTKWAEVMTRFLESSPP